MRGGSTAVHRYVTLRLARIRFWLPTGAIETAGEFGKRLYLEAWKRGWSRAKQKVVMGDGAEWIWNLAAQHFPGATQIVDLYHVRQHLWELARQFHPNEETLQNRWMLVHQDLLDHCKIKKLVASLRSIAPPSAAGWRQQKKILRGQLFEYDISLCSGITRSAGYSVDE
jgi:hypothetical protein